MIGKKFQSPVLAQGLYLRVFVVRRKQGHSFGEWCAFQEGERVYVLIMPERHEIAHKFILHFPFCRNII